MRTDLLGVVVRPKVTVPPSAEKRHREFWVPNASNELLGVVRGVDRRPADGELILTVMSIAGELRDFPAAELVVQPSAYTTRRR